LNRVFTVKRTSVKSANPTELEAALRRRAVVLGELADERRDLRNHRFCAQLRVALKLGGWIALFRGLDTTFHVFTLFCTVKSTHGSI
jgi:hypothetical protein